MPDDDFSLSDISFEKVKFTKEHLMVMIMGIGLFAFIIFAVQELGWWINEMAGAFFLMGILAVIISRMSLVDASEAFVSGYEGNGCCCTGCWICSWCAGCFTGWTNTRYNNSLRSFISSAVSRVCCSWRNAGFPDHA